MPETRDEGASLEAPAAAAKEEQLAQHGGNSISGGVRPSVAVGWTHAHRAMGRGRPDGGQGMLRSLASGERADDPLGPPMSKRVLRAVLKSPAEPAQTWFVPGDTPGSARGSTTCGCPTGRTGNGPACTWRSIRTRRRGIGSALLRHAAERAAADGRSCSRPARSSGRPERRSPCMPGLRRASRRPGGSRFWRSCPRVRSPRSAKPEQAAAGYTLVTWTDRTPEEYLAGAAAVFNAMSDAPHNPGHESRVWDAERVREQLDNQRELFGSRGYFVAALCVETAMRDFAGRGGRRTPGGERSRSPPWPGRTAGTGSACWSRPRCWSGSRRRSRSSSGS